MVERLKGVPKDYLFLMLAFDLGEFDYKKFLQDNPFQFKDVLHDLFACLNCEKACGSTFFKNGKHDIVSNPIYYGVSYASTKYYKGTRPCFSVFKCPGISERKEELISVLKLTNSMFSK